MLIPSPPERGQEGQKGGPYLLLISGAAACLWLWRRDAPRPCSQRHVSLPVPDNDLPCTNRGLSPNTGCFLAVAEASGENLQIPDCNRYQGKKHSNPDPFSSHIHKQMCLKPSEHHNAHCSCSSVPSSLLQINIHDSLRFQVSPRGTV